RRLRPQRHARGAATALRNRRRAHRGRNALGPVPAGARDARCRCPRDPGIRHRPGQERAPTRLSPRARGPRGAVKLRASCESSLPITGWHFFCPPGRETMSSPTNSPDADPPPTPAEKTSPPPPPEATTGSEGPRGRRLIVTSFDDDVPDLPEAPGAGFAL